MNTAYIGLSTNLGNKIQNITDALDKIASKCEIKAKSNIYLTEPWGVTDQPDYYNQCIQIETELTAQDLLNFLLHTENELGRVRLEKYGARTMDLDLLLFNQEIINTPNLQVPHPLLTERKFVLAPLQEIAADQIHPINNLTISQLYQQCSDQKQYSILA